MSLISSVHLLRRMNNAFWNGEQMVYGDGDGKEFIRFTKALDVVGHELSHGVVAHTCRLAYRNESGALNEHFADVFGVLVKQWKKKGAPFPPWGERRRMPDGPIVNGNGRGRVRSSDRAPTRGAPTFCHSRRSTCLIDRKGAYSR